MYQQESCLSCNILLLLSKNNRVSVCLKKTGATGDNRKNKNLDLSSIVVGFIINCSTKTKKKSDSRRSPNQ